MSNEAFYATLALEGTIFTLYGIQKKNEFQQGYRDGYEKARYSSDGLELEKEGRVPSWKEIGRYFGARKAGRER